MTDTSSPLTPAQMLAIHREIWDMPTLSRKHPEIIEHLADRYEVHFGMVSDVIVVHKDENRIEGFDTTDVRVAVDTLLAREAGQDPR